MTKDQRQHHENEQNHLHEHHQGQDHGHHESGHLHAHEHSHHHRHEHGLRSSKEFLDASSLLKIAGLAHGHTFLDVGCGDGHFSIAASSIVGPEATVHAIDVEPLGIEMITAEMKEKSITNIRAEVMDASRDLPSPSPPPPQNPVSPSIPDTVSDRKSGFNFILMSNILHGFVANGEFDAVIRNIKDVQSTGGKVAIIEFKKEETEFGPPVEVRLSEEQTEKLFSGNGYSIDKRTEAGPAHYMLTFIRE